MEPVVLKDEAYFNNVAKAAEFLKIGKRLCTSYPLCTGCPVLEINKDCKLRFDAITNPENIAATVFSWGNRHPEMTNKEKFFETFGKLSYEDRRLIMAEEFGFQKWLEKEYKKPKEEADE